MTLEWWDWRGWGVGERGEEMEAGGMQRLWSPICSLFQWRKHCTCFFDRWTFPNDSSDESGVVL